jgi:antitoxin component YwqK of YwqJK toxin-antitoxin module
MDRRTERIDYDDAGWAEIQYVGDDIDGLWTVYFASGKKNWEREYTSGQQHGYERQWSQDGQLIDEKHFRNGQLHGRWRIWYLNGQLNQESHFENGDQEGQATWWDEDGSIIAQGRITNGVYDGSFVMDVWDEESETEKEMVVQYRNGQRITPLE